MRRYVLSDLTDNRRIKRRITSDEELIMSDEG